MVLTLQSYLFSEPKHTVSTRYRSGRVEQTWTRPMSPDHPVYVLINRSTSSAGEDFATTLQQPGRMVVVGERTRGGAHPVKFVRFTELCIEMSIPNTCSEARALDIAHEHALWELLDRPSGNGRLTGL